MGLLSDGMRLPQYFYHLKRKKAEAKGRNVAFSKESGRAEKLKVSGRKRWKKCICKLIFSLAVVFVFFFLIQINYLQLTCNFILQN